MSDHPAIVFDIGNVLIHWDPELLYRQLIPEDAARAAFLAEVCTPAWNLEQDRGRSFAEGVELLTRHHPDKADLIRAYDMRWEEMVPGAIEGSVALLADLRAAGLRTYAITNFSAEKYALSLARFPFLRDFLDVVVSAHERVVKPDAAIYRALLQRNGLGASECIFIDDNAGNVDGARAVGMEAIRFTTPEALRAALRRLAVPGA